MNANLKSPRARRVLLTLGLGLILLGLVCMYVAILPTERTVTYNGPMNDSIVIGKIPGRIGWTGGGYLRADFNATGGTLGNPLYWYFVPEQGSSGEFGGDAANGSFSQYELPMDQTLNIELSREWGGSGNVSARIHWRVDGMNPQLFVPGMVSLVAGIPVSVMGLKKKERLMSLADFEKQVKL